jgi:hypothetical protein
MSLDVNFQDKEDYVIADINGTFSQMNALILFQKLVEFSSETEHDNLLLDCRGVDGEVMSSDIFAFSKKAGDIMKEYNLEGRIVEMKKAYVFDEEKYDLDQAGEDLFEGEDIDFFITKDFENALKWLGVQN